MTDTRQTSLDLAAPAPTGAGAGPARALTEALRNHFIRPGDAFPGGAFLTEVEAPIDGAVRRADAVYVCFTRTPGWGIDVCEVKTSRADLRREIDNPAKTDAWWPYSSRFWIVSPSPSVTPPDILPDGWGLLCPKRSGRRFQVHKEPAVRQPIVDLGLLITLMKKVDLERPRLIREAEERGAREVRQLHDRNAAALDEMQSRLEPTTVRRLAALDQMEETLGIELVGYAGMSQAGATVDQMIRAWRTAIELVKSGDAARRKLDSLARDAERVNSAAAAVAAAVQTARTALDAFAPKEPSM